MVAPLSKLEYNFRSTQKSALAKMPKDVITDRVT